MREATIAYGGFFYLVRSLLKEWEATFAYGGFFYLVRPLLKEWEATIAYGVSTNLGTSKNSYGFKIDIVLKLFQVAIQISTKFIFFTFVSGSII